MVSSTMGDMQWKPINTINEKQPPQQSSSIKNTHLPGHNPRLLSNGHSAIIQKRQDFPSHHPPNKKFHILSIDQFNPQFRRKQQNQLTPSIVSNHPTSSSSSSTLPNNSHFTNGTTSSESKQQQQQQNNNNNNN